MNTSPLSMLEYLTDIKESLITNNPKFSVKNEKNIDIIIDSFEKLNLQVLDQSIAYVHSLMVGFNISILVLIVIIKIFEIKFQCYCSQIFKIY